MTKDFIEKLIFEYEKDTPFNNVREFYKKINKTYHLKGNYTDLYVKIINYQINNYGMNLSYTIYNEKRNYESCLRDARNSRQRKYRWRKREKKEN